MIVEPINTAWAERSQDMLRDIKERASEIKAMKREIERLQQETAE